MRCNRFRSAAWVGGWILAMSVVAVRGEIPVDRPPIDYHKTTATDPIARLQLKLDRGEVRLKHDGTGHGYIRSVMDALKVPVESQSLVFSKTSFQHAKIGPRMPRAIYFGDDVYVGWVRGGDYLEFSTVDPKLGATFYLLDAEKTEKPAFLRQGDTCLQCHHSSKTQDVPGHLVRSVYPDRSGFPVYHAGTYVTDPTSPFNERWGGWYVTGTHGSLRHLGNLTYDNPERPETLDLSNGANRTDLKGLVDLGSYLSSHSDIVALMVLEHQTQLHNSIAFARYQAELGRYYDDGMNKAFGRPPGTQSDTTQRRIDSAAETLVKALLFSGELRLTAPIKGTSGFTEVFSKQGPKDSQGRSLRDFDLKTRLFRYPCSYLIDSEAFHALPRPVKDRVFRRLREILTGRETDPAYAHLTPDDRRAILEILKATHSGLPDDWKTLTVALPQ